MIIFWRGWGIVGAILMIVVYLGCLEGAQRYLPGHDWTWLVSAWLAAAAVYGFDAAIRKYQEYDHPRPVHDFMFIPMRGWVGIMICLGIYVYFNHH